MPAIRELSSPPAVAFPLEWFSMAGPESFWMQWRFEAFRRMLMHLGMPLGVPWRALDIGCGNGVLRMQMEGCSAWIVDGADLHRGALEMNADLRGDCLLYDVADRRAELRDRYDALFLFDVLEHIEDPMSFLRDCLFHLKVGGRVFVNVPALESMRSQYDEIAGHLRRYDRGSLQRQLESLGLRIEGSRYWGFSLLPLLPMRKVLLMGTPREKVLAKGFTPPGWMADQFLKALMRVETRCLHSPPLGTSLMAAAVKSGGSTA